jgi:hypothetical protein
MCVLSTNYSYVFVGRFCAVRYIIIIRFSLSFSNYSTYGLVIFFYICFLLCILVFCFVYFVFLYCFVYFFLLLCCLFRIFVQVNRTPPPGGKTIAVNKYNHNHRHNHVECIKLAQAMIWWLVLEYTVLNLWLL